MSYGQDLRGCIFGLVATFAIIFFFIGFSLGHYNAAHQYDNMQFIKPLEQRTHLYFNENNEVDTLYIYKFSESE